MSGRATERRRDPDVLVDWSRTLRRMRRSAIGLGGLTLVAWLASGLIGGRLTLASLFDWLALALAVMFVIELVVVGGSALRGMLRAGERGERLARPDVGLLPSRRRRDRRVPEDGA